MAKTSRIVRGKVPANSQQLPFAWILDVKNWSCTIRECYANKRNHDMSYFPHAHISVSSNTGPGPPIKQTHFMGSLLLGLKAVLPIRFSLSPKVYGWTDTPIWSRMGPKQPAFYLAVSQWGIL